jgi:hypothetical protein
MGTNLNYGAQFKSPPNLPLGLNGIIIHPEAVIGDNCTIYQQVTIAGKNGVLMTKRCAFCFETQVFPDSPNHPEWHKCIYDAGEKYSTTTIFAFSIID